MTNVLTEAAGIIAGAVHAWQQGRAAEARSVLTALLESEPENPAALNALGKIAVGERRETEALSLFRRATSADPNAPRLWLNLAEAQQAVGDLSGAIRSVDTALQIDPYMLVALLHRAKLFELVGQPSEAAQMYRRLLAAFPDTAHLPQAIQRALVDGRAAVEADDARRASVVAVPADAVFARFPDADHRRAQAYLQHLAGQRKTYVQEPVGPFFPGLPAIEFFDRALFAWFAELEAGTDAIRAEYLALKGSDQFTPYVQYAPGTPVNQWAELNHDDSWSVFFLWREGLRQDENCARCPTTVAVLDRLPLLDIPHHAPNIMFSVLKPNTRIPPHTGFTNTRATVHLPLIVPEGCEFRVGSETRPWIEGEAFAFDDTIEHEAWNHSDLPRAVLILDAWNPLLTEVEKAIVRSATAAL